MVRAAACKALGQIGSLQGRPYIEKAAYDKEWRTRTEAAHYAIAKARQKGLDVWIMLVPDCVNGAPKYFACRWPDQMQQVINSYDAQLENGTAYIELHRDKRYGKSYKGIDRIFRPKPDGLMV